MEDTAAFHKTTFVYDADNRVIEQDLPTGGKITMAYDGNSRLISETDALGRRIAYNFDGVGNKLGETWYNADGTVNSRLTFSYDGNNNQLTAQNAVGTYTMAYDAANEVTSVQEPYATILTFTYRSYAATKREEDTGIPLAIAA